MKKTKSQEFLEKLVNEIGGEIHDESKWNEIKKGQKGSYSTSAGLPTHNRAYFTYKDLPFEVDFYSQQEITIQINLKPPSKMFIGHKNFFTKIFSFGVKIGNPDFDKKYSLEYITEETAKKLINADFRANLSQLEPFIAIKLTRKEYLLLKDVNLSKYTVAQAIQDFDHFINIYNLIKNLES